MRYIGGKTQLLGEIDTVIRENTNGSESIFCDLFSGTGSVSRYFKPRYEIHSNDLLHFSYIIQKATIENNKHPRFESLAKAGIPNPLKFLEETKVDDLYIDNNSFFITQNYSPNDNCDRMYISKQNALRIDFIRSTIESWKARKLICETEYYYLLAALIEGVPYISNITGTYGAYLKKWDKRALKELEMARLDVLDNGRNNKSYNVDANKLIRELEGNILYLDPPYNSRQYAPNYHLLETISKYDNPDIKGVTGMRPYKDSKSSYCIKREVLDVFEDLIDKAKFDNIILSYSNDGLMSSKQIEDVFKKYGIENSFRRYDIPYRKYRAKISKENESLQEYLFYIRKEIAKPKIFFTNTQNTVYNNTIKRHKYLKSPLNYIGGKYKLLSQILPLFPANISTFVDMFAGGCNVGINVQADKIICNDINSKIIDMFKMFQLSDKEEIMTKIKKTIEKFNLSKENEKGYIEFREYYNKTQNPIDLYTLTCYSFNYQFRFNNDHKYNNPFGRNRSYFSENMQNNLIMFIEQIKNQNIIFKNDDFINIDLDYLGRDDFVYCDPPYLITTGSYNDGNRGFKDWTERQDKELYELLDKLNNKGVKFALSNVLMHKNKTNDILLKWSEKYKINYLNYNYNNASYNTKKGESVEVLITNYLPEK